MGPKQKSSGVSTSTFFDLRAEIAKHEEEFAKNKASGKGKLLVGGVKRPDKKPAIWAKQNKGLSSRAARDIELEEISKPTLDTARAILERKAKVYDKLRKGKTGGLSEKQYDTLLVDFDQKPIDAAYESDSDDVDESLTVPEPPRTEEAGFVCTTNGEVSEDDPVIEYEDEFGRVRTARKSEVPRHLMSSEHKDEPPEDIDPYVIYNPVNHFPVYEPSAERVAEIAAEYAEESNPLNLHYDATREVRAKGAGFYQFSGDEETRKRQMEELKKAREETEKTREQTGAVDLRPGEVEGMVAPEGASERALQRSRAMEKRKREIEERRKTLEAKRRKRGPEEESSRSAAESTPPAPPPKRSLAADPFAALEAQTTRVHSSISKGKAKEYIPTQAETEADAFLAALERDVLKKTPPCVPKTN